MVHKKQSYPKNTEFFSLDQRKEKLMVEISRSIHQCLNLGQIFQQTVTAIRDFLATDRVLIYRFEPDWSGIIVSESVIEPWARVLGQEIKDPCFSNEYIESYLNGRVQVVEDVENANLHPCHFDMLTAFKVKANLVIPIVAQQKLWGLLIVQHCRGSRHWQAINIEFLKNLSIQLAIAIQETELHEEIRCLNNYLELKVKQSTIKLRQSLEYEALVRKLTEKVRDSLDEAQILQTITEELAQILAINHCKIDLYDSDQNQTTVVYEYAHNIPVCQGITLNLDKCPQFFQQLLQKQTLQIVSLVPIFANHCQRLNRLICPIFDDQGVLGNLWLIRPSEQIFNDLEIKLVQQLTTQCAIAIRQARLYQASQVQVEELEKLNTLKDDFLKTISHELRTPMTSIIAGAQTLEKIINQNPELWQNSQHFHKVLHIFYQACHQQKQLVDDLLSLCYIDARKEIINLELINIALLVESITQPFWEYTKRQKQRLVLDISPDLPRLKSDPHIVKRILTELLNNAYKYTPSEEVITFSVDATNHYVEFKVSNSGVEIALEEQAKIFDKFYRIPNNDPWKYGGTGLGLALVQKLVELLQGTITVVTQPNQTIFTVKFSL